jgi:hypothetical protein
MGARNTKALPGFLDNEVYGDMLAAFLDDAATTLDQTGSALSASNVRGARRAAREIREFHGIEHDADEFPLRVVSAAHDEAQAAMAAMRDGTS